MENTSKKVKSAYAGAVALVAALGFTFTLCMFFDRTGNPPWLMFWLVWFSLSGWIFTLLLLLEVKTVHKKFMTMFLPQDILDLRLQQLAKALNALCNRQVRLRREKPGTHELDDVTAKIAAAKSDFWDTAMFAGDLGYKVNKLTYKGYLVLPIHAKSEVPEIQAG